jgi:DNA polymerase alpha subunit A
VLPLSKVVSNISGGVWNRTLAGARAQRIEMLLLHEFHSRKFLLPDKLTARDKERLAAAREGGDEEDGEGGGGGGKKAAGAPGGKGPQYAGGLVLEPKRGLYDKFVLLLDFNSLYPSIIQARGRQRSLRPCLAQVARCRVRRRFGLPPPPAPPASSAPLSLNPPSSPSV